MVSLLLRAQGMMGPHGYGLGTPSIACLRLGRKELTKPGLHKVLRLLGGDPVWTGIKSTHLSVFPSKQHQSWEVPGKYLRLMSEPSTSYQHPQTHLELGHHSQHRGSALARGLLLGLLFGVRRK